MQHITIRIVVVGFHINHPGCIYRYRSVIVGSKRSQVFTQQTNCVFVSRSSGGAGKAKTHYGITSKHLTEHIIGVSHNHLQITRTGSAVIKICPQLQTLSSICIYVPSYLESIAIVIFNIISRPINIGGLQWQNSVLVTKCIGNDLLPFIQVAIIYD